MQTLPPAYFRTRARVEDYFDRSATKVWEQLTSDAPVSGVRATVRAGRDKMRALMLEQVPEDLSGARVLDAGCGTGAMAVELAQRGADVLAIDISPSLIEIAESRRPRRVAGSLMFRAGDMLDPKFGVFDYVMAMDSMIYYSADDIGTILSEIAPRLRNSFVFTLPPRTRMLMAMWRVGKLFPRANRSPVMVPHTSEGIANAARTAGADGTLHEIGAVNSGFYHSNALAFRSRRQA
ncbi:MAG: magnesium protoporphyrin IX methyltransferase [Paracoccaceae bacterium]